MGQKVWLKRIHNVQGWDLRQEIDLGIQKGRLCWITKDIELLLEQWKTTQK